MRSGILSSDHLFKRMSTWWDPGSFQLIISSEGCRHDEIRDLVIWSSLQKDVDMMRSRILLSRSSLLKDVDMMRSGILSSDHLFYRMSTWWDPGSCHLIISSKWCRHDEIRDLVIWSSLLKDVDMMRSGILSSDHFFYRMSTWWDPGSCHLIISSTGCRHDEIRDLVIWSFR